MHKLRTMLLAVTSTMLLAQSAGAINLADEQRAVDEWRKGRIERLTGPNGWLTLIGLFWLKPGDNTFGRAESNALILDNNKAADRLGTFAVKGHQVEFTVHQAGITHNGKAITKIAMAPDTSGDPTVLKSGSIEFFVIERAGKLGVRVRDTEHPARIKFRGIDSYPISTDWVIDAKFEPYAPVKYIEIVNILGMTEKMVSPGAVVFKKGGVDYRLDAILEAPDDKELFIMFADATSGRETYGAGRFLYIPLPQNGRAILDFNKAYNPPCAFNDFATCPLPPWQNRLKLRVDAGEKKYSRPE